MKIIEIAQGRYRRLDGADAKEALAAFKQDDEEFLAQNPRCRKYHQPCWRQLEVRDDERAPWGHEWYVVDEAGRLKMHSAQYDSSG